MVSHLADLLDKATNHALLMRRSFTALYDLLACAPFFGKNNFCASMPLSTREQG